MKNLVTRVTQIKNRPLPFTVDMVRAVLDDLKSKTRRVIQPQPIQDENGHWLWANKTTSFRAFPDEWLIHCPYGKSGDHLWVREPLRRCQDSEGSKPLALYDCGRKPVYRYGELAEWQWKNSVLPSRFMPRWASRISLEVVSVCVERLQDITEEDAKAEGAPGIATHKPYPRQFRDSFEVLWDSINAGRGFGWDVNPWVWVVEFKKLEHN